MIEFGGRAPNHAMREERPSITTRHSYLTIFKKTKDRSTLDTASR